MATPRINGTLEPIRKSVRTNFDPAKGFTVTEEYESAGDNLGGLATQSQANKIQYEHTANPVISRLIMTHSGAAAGYGEQVTDTWQLLANQIQRDIKEHPATLALPSSGPGSLRNVLGHVQAFNNGEEVAQTLTGASLALFELLTHGVTSYTLDQHVVRHTLNVPIEYSGLITYSTIPGLMTSVLNGIAVNGPNDGINFVWGWRRTGYQYTISANNRIEVSTEWALASWSLYLYPSGASATPL